MNRFAIGQKVLVKSLSLEYSDYKNIDGEVTDVDGDYCRVSIPCKKICLEDLRELRKAGDRAFVRVKVTSLT